MLGFFALSGQQELKTLGTLKSQTLYGNVHKKDLEGLGEAWPWGVAGDDGRPRASVRDTLVHPAPKGAARKPEATAGVAGLIVLLKHQLKKRGAHGIVGLGRKFRIMDDDGSGKITYTELADLVRNELQLDERQCPDLRLRGVWRALDADGSGYLTAGEFGHFMKRGEEKLRQLHPQSTWKQLLHRERRAHDQIQRERRPAARNDAGGGGVLGVGGRGWS